MKYLKIDNDKGYYWDGNAYQEIDNINKDAILELLNNAENEDFDLDAYNEDDLGNKAHQIIYENIYLKFQTFLGDKDVFKKEVENLFKDSVIKYSADVESEDLEELTSNSADQDTALPEGYSQDEQDSEDLPF